MAELRSVSSARNSTDSFPSGGSTSTVTEQDTTKSLKNTSFEVRPDFVTTAELDTIEKEVSRIVYDETSNTNKYWNGTGWVSLLPQEDLNDSVQGYIGLLSGFYFDGVATPTVIDTVDTWTDVELTIDSQGTFDNRPTDMKDSGAGYTGTGANGDPIIFSLEGLDITSFASLNASLNFVPEDDEGQLESRLLFERHTGTTPSTDFPIEEVTLTMQQGADIPYSAEPNLSFFIGDTIDTNGAGDAGKVRLQVKSDVEGILSLRGLTLFVNK